MTWKTQPLRKFKIKTLRLQCKIYKAMRQKNIKYVSKLQKILINSFATRYTTVEQLMSHNLSHKVANKKKVIFPKNIENIKCIESFSKKCNKTKYFSVQKIPITKPKEERQIFKKLTTADQIVKCVWTRTLNPTYKAIFSCESHRFRPGKNQWNLQKAILIWVNKLSPSFKAKVLKMEINSRFDKMDHSLLMKELILPQKNKIGIFRILKTGISYRNVLNSNEKITRKALKPFLGNLALHKVENLNESKNFQKQVLKPNCYFSKGFRYANNVIYILEENENEDVLIGRIKNFFKNRSLELNITKLDVTKIADGFNLLEWRFRITKKGKLISYPNEHHWIAYKTKVKLVLKNSRYKIQTRIDQVKVIIQRWHNYHKFCDMTQVKSQLYELKIWYNKYIKLYTKIPKEERILSLRRLFSNHSFKVIRTNSSFHEKASYWRKSICK
jgi:retron-type reverse transcriptase